VHQSLRSTEKRRSYPSLEALIERYTGGAYEQPYYRLGTTDMALRGPGEGWVLGSGRHQARHGAGGRRADEKMKVGRSPKGRLDSRVAGNNLKNINPATYVPISD
jgi:hypothetical protein